MTDTDTVIAGAGVTGLAVARELAMAGQSVIILESAGQYGSGISSRNSEVIHAGLYYPETSLRARFCVEGNRLLYDFCAGHGVAHRRCGKLIVATSGDEIPLLEALYERGRANGCGDLAMLGRQEAIRLEPELACHAALLSPSTGIVDSHGLMLSLLGDASEAGAALALNTPLVSARATGDGFIVSTGGADPMDLSCKRLVNAAGLDAPQLAVQIEGLHADFIPQAFYAKGNYFSLSARAPFSRLIYPAPQKHGLGVHLTFDLGGQARFGPDVEWIDRPDYTVDPERASGFDEAIRRYWPGLPENSLHPAYSGIRPKISGPSDPAADFRIDGPDFHGVAGLVNLFGIESPGLTSSLAIAREVARMLR